MVNSKTMEYPKTILFFLDGYQAAGEPVFLPSMGIHALSAYLRERDAPASAWQLRGDFPAKWCNKILMQIGENQSSIADFEKSPGAWLQKNLPAANCLRLRLILDLGVELLKKQHASIVGFTLYRINMAISLLLAARIKELLPDRTIVFGGPEVKPQSLRSLLQYPFIDFLIQGEGEEALFQLVQSKAERKQPSFPGIHSQDGIFKGPLSPPLNMGTLPPPDFDTVSILKDIVAMPIEFNRGCVAKCKFCEETRFWKVYRSMSVERAVERFQFLKEKYGYTRFFLSQSLMNGDMKWLKALAVELIKSKTEVLWGGNSRIHPHMDHDFLQLLYDAGCRFFNFGIESGSQEILKSMKKGVRVDAITKVLSASHEIGMWNHTYWIFGYPGETLEDLTYTAEFIAKHSHWIHSHQYHEYGEPDLIGNQPDVYSYVGSMSRLFQNFGDFYKEHRDFIRKLFNVERRLLKDGDVGIPRWREKALEVDNEERQEYQLRSCLVRRFTMDLLLSYLKEPSQRTALKEKLVLPQFQESFLEHTSVQQL